MTTVDRTRLAGWLAVAIAIASLARYGLVFAKDFGDHDDHHDDHHGADEPGEPPPPPYEDAARQLLGGLDAGDRLAPDLDWIVDHVSGPLDDGDIVIVLARDAQTLSLRVRPRHESERPPPIRTDAHDLYYNRPDPLTPKVKGAELRALMVALAQRVEANE